MIEKFNKKYGDKLSSRQRELLTSKLVLDESRVVDCVRTIKKEAKDSVLSFYKDCDNAFLNAKKSTILERIDNLKVSSEDLVVERALALSALIEELESNDG